MVKKLVLGLWTSPRGIWPLGKRLNSCPAQRGASDRNVVGVNWFLTIQFFGRPPPACAFDDIRPWSYPSLSVCFAVSHVHGNLVKSLLWAIDLRKLFFECVVLLAGHCWVRWFFHMDAKMKNFFWKQRNSRRWIALNDIGKHKSEMLSSMLWSDTVQTTVFCSTDGSGTCLATPSCCKICYW